MKIAVDVMGGDEGPRSYVSACLKFLSLRSDVQLTLFGDSQQIKSFLPSTLPHGLNITHSQVQVNPSDKPGMALRSMRESSMAMAVKAVAEGCADACVSSGNTGALMGFGLHYLTLQEGIERPAICKAMPSRSGVCYLLDIGANIHCTSSHLVQFAHLGMRFAQSGGIHNPRVGLLNVGTEAQKGADLQREAAGFLSSDELIDFIGFVEGGDIYRGVVDVVVCDGFSGNVLLKASEGAAEFMRSSLSEAFKRNFWGRLSGILAYPLLSSWQSQFDPSRYNGAIFLGFNGVVVKSHGSAEEAGLVNALQVAYAHASGVRQS